MPEAQQKFNRENYDQVMIRFPKGTRKRFKEIWGSGVSFNGWVVNLVCSRLLIKEMYFPEKPMPYPDEPLDRVTKD